MCDHTYRVVDRFMPEREWIYIGHGWSMKAAIFEVTECTKCKHTRFESNVESAPAAKTEFKRNDR